MSKDFAFYFLMILILILLIPSYLFQGAVDIHWRDILKISSDSSLNANLWATQVFWEVRFPRLILAMLCGSGLAIAGAMVQGVFRNPLVEPGLIGITSGAALFASFAIVFLENSIQALFLLQGISFLGAVTVSLLVYFISSKDGKVSVITLLLMGIGINASVGAIMGLLHYLASDTQLRAISFWGMGSLSLASWDIILSILPFSFLLYFSIPFFSGGLNAFMLGENEANHLGYNTNKLKISLLIVVCLSVGTFVSITGIIGFIGLVVPHIVRIWGRANHQFLLPASGVLGAILLIASDALARILVSPSELPIGILTAGIGSPLFLYILSKQIKQSL
jgi:iron complex transport system permease protein